MFSALFVLVFSLVPNVTCVSRLSTRSLLPPSVFYNGYLNLTYVTLMALLLLFIETNKEAANVIVYRILR